MRLIHCSLYQLVLTAVFLVRSVGSVWALPIETFNVPSETKCKGDRTCKRGLSSVTSLGGYLGIEVTNPAEGQGVTLLELKTGPMKGRVVWGAAGNPAGRVTFSWDGDPNGGQISGAGLGCLDITADGATAFILEDLAYSATCSSAKGKGASGELKAGDCPPLVIEAKLYDANDPTGQRYSTSVIRRQFKFSGRDLRVPFSSFTREGPNGGSRVSCVGVISITIRADELTKSVVTFGSFYTNGACQSGDCLLPPPYSAGISPVGSPSPTPTVVVTTTGGPTGTPSPLSPAHTTPRQTPTTTPSPKTTIKTSPAPSVTVTPTSTLTPSVSQDRAELPRESVIGSAEETSLDVPPVEDGEESPAPVTEEYVYGDIIERGQPTVDVPLPTPTPYAVRRPTPTVDLIDTLS